MIAINAVEKRYPLSAGFFAHSDRAIHAVNGVSLRIETGAIYGLVGESGCGKTTLARMLVRMERPSQGTITFTARDGQRFDLGSLKGQPLRELRNRVRYIFQDPARSLNPRFSVAELLLSGYRYSPRWPGRAAAQEEICRLMVEVGLKESDLQRRPADFSGGQRRRISIARALITAPEVLICDEVVSALDVSIQGQILALLLQLRRERNLTIIFIAHDLAVVGYVSDRIGVMYRGVLVEEAPAPALLSERQHPYTQYLFAALPRLGAQSGQQARAARRYAGTFDPTQPPLADASQTIMDEQPGGRRVSRAFLEADLR